MPDTATPTRPRALPELVAPVDPARFVDVTGERIALIGREDGPFECWMWPIKVLSQLTLRVFRFKKPLDVARKSVRVLPGELEFLWEDEGFRLRAELFACRERAGLACALALDSEEPIELEFAFRCDFRPMWPAGLGGQLVRLDPVTQAFTLTEELGRWAVLVGGPKARLEFEPGDHALPEGLVRLYLPMLPGGSSTVFAIAGAELAPEPLSDAARRGDEQAATGFARAEKTIHVARELWWRLVSDFSAEHEAVRAHWRAHQSRVVELATPEPALDEAVRWAAIAIERSWVRVDGLGRGLVAGIGPSGAGERPGYAWFFDGDALAASRAQTTAGDFAGAREVLRFAAAHQRADGKLMHELSLSAQLCRWLEDYPYAYYKGLNSADFVAALELYLRYSGDLELARELWPAAERALEWCARSLDGEGRLANSLAGIAAVEAGPLSDKIECEVFLQGAWAAALAAGQRLASALGHDLARWRTLEERLRAAFEAFWCEEKGHHGFALLRGGGRCDDLTAYLGYPLSRGLGERTRAWQSVQALNRPSVMSDWGARMFARDASLYDGTHYNHGAVFPYLTNFSTLALFAHGHALAAWQVLDSQVALTGFDGLGLVDEHLEGEHARAPKRGVPHQIFSSAAIVESVLLGLFGLDASVPEKRLALRPSLPASWDEARLTNLRVGETVVDLRLYRRREPGATVLGLELTRAEGPALTLGFAPVLPPLSRLLDGPGWLRPSGAVVPRRVHRVGSEPLRLEARVLEGPSVRLPSTLPARGGTSRNARLVEQRVEGEALLWRFEAPAATRTVLPFACDFPVEVRGANPVPGGLELSFPAGPEGAWTALAVEVRAR